MRIFWLIPCVLFGLTDAVLFNVNCDYKQETWDVISPYYCDVQNNINVILNEGVTLNSANGDHETGMNNNDVNCFYATDKNFQFFPKDLDKIFNNLEGIIIANAQLKVVHQINLKPFTNLVHLGLHINEIEVIEEDLFKFNPNLKMISLRNNKIKEIHSKVFDDLPHLLTLRLLENQCIDKDSNMNSTAVMNTIKYVKLLCTIPEQVNIGMEIKALEKAINHFKLEDNEDNNTENEENFAKIEAQIKDLGLPKTHELSKMLDEVHVVKIPFAVSLFKEIHNSNQKSREDLKACQASIQDLNQQVSMVQDELKNLKSEVSSGFQKILKKLDENSGKIEREVTEKVKEMSINLQTAQNQTLSDMSDKIKNLENNLNSF